MRGVLRDEKPGVVIHTAAMTDVDGCESRRDEAFRDNFEATSRLADSCNDISAALIFISTDYVFDGGKKGEYKEEDATGPLSVYGQSKLKAEEYLAVHCRHYLIFRTSWLYGLHGKSFPRTILERARTMTAFTVVCDQVGRPTYTRDMAAAFLDLLRRDGKLLSKADRQIFHWAGGSTASWADFARGILKAGGFVKHEVRDMDSSQLDRPAKRPQNSVFCLNKTQSILGIKMRPWEEAIRDFVQEYRAWDQATLKKA